MNRMFWAVNVLLAGVFATLPVLATEPGFGVIRKKTVNLQVRQPALVRLANTSVAFTGKASNPEYQPVLDSLLATLSTEIVKHENSLVVKQDSTEAEWTLYMTVTGYAVPPVQKSTEQVGKTTVVKDRWTGSLNVSYQVLDRIGKVHDADNISVNYDKVFQEGSRDMVWGVSVPIHLPRKKTDEKIPLSTEDVKQILVHKVADEVGTKLGNTSVVLPVKVATGEDHMNRAADLMDQRLWSRALEELQSSKAFSDAGEESYRLYDLGLAYEAMSYEAKGYKDQRANLFQAQEFYSKAMDTNRGEKYFVETVARIRDSIAKYKTLDQQQAKDAKTVVPAPHPPVATPPVATETADAKTHVPAPDPPPAASKANTAAQIIEMYKQNVPKPQIIEIIRSAPLDFNPRDIPTVLAITKAKLPNDIQNEMRKKVGADPLPVIKSKSPAPPAAISKMASGSKP